MSHDTRVGVQRGSGGVREDACHLLLEVLGQVGGDASAQLDDGGQRQEGGRRVLGDGHAATLLRCPAVEQGRPACSRWTDAPGIDDRDAWLDKSGRWSLGLSEPFAFH
jgi:hypothetical protein